MLTRQIDAALDSLWACRERLPFLAGLHPLGTPERTALDEILAAIERADKVMGSGAAANTAGRGRT